MAWAFSGVKPGLRIQQQLQWSGAGAVAAPGYGDIKDGSALADSMLLPQQQLDECVHALCHAVMVCMVRSAVGRLYNHSAGAEREHAANG